MGLVGNLSDLSLVELLQMAAMAGKSGVLEIRGGAGAAWVGFSDGAIVRVARSDRPLERKGILAEAGLDADDEGPAADDALHEAALSSMIELFEWTDADFRFDTAADPGRDEDWEAPEGVQLAVRISPQFLALEVARIQDEPEGGVSEGEAPPRSPERPSESADRLPTPAECAIIVDSELRLLEAIKAGLALSGVRVHIFQSPADALNRFKQYVLRGESPAVVLGQGAIDPMTPRSNSPRDLAKRVRSLAGAVGTILLSAEPAAARDPFDVVLARPETHASDDAISDLLVRLRRALGASA
jgi:hypothetical protein